MMEPANALQQVKKELETTFGTGLAAIIVMTARNKSNAPVIGFNKDHYLKVLENACADPRVVGMLGAAGTKEKLTKWKLLV